MTAAMGQARALFDSALTTATDECILWPYSTNRGGYAQINIGRRPRLGHVIACEQRNGPRPPGMDAAHYCGIKGCINPRHLRWATRAENNGDKLDHGTLPIGAKHWKARLTVESVREIRRRAGTCTNGELAQEFGVTDGAIRAVINRRCWAWLP